MKIKKYFLAFIASALMISLLWQQRFILTRVTDVSAVQHHGTLIVFINLGSRGVYGNIWQIYLKQFVGFYAVNDTRKDLLIWHLQDRTLKQYKLNNFEHGGPGVYRGELYYRVRKGQRQGLALVQNWRWTGSGLTRVEEPENTALTDIFRQLPEKGFSPESSWREVPTPNWTQRNVRVKLGSDLYFFTQREAPRLADLYWEEYALRGPGIQKPELVRYRWENRGRSVSKKTYDATFGAPEERKPE